MKYLVTLAAIAGLMVLVVGCGGEKGSETHEATPTETESATSGTDDSTAKRIAKARFEPKSGSQVAGTAKFEGQDGKVVLWVTLQNLEPGLHAIHIHETGDCASADGKSAGGHWNPSAEDHGKWGDPQHHLGDIGNVEAKDDGSGMLKFLSTKWTIGTGEPNDIVGKALIVHSGVDDFLTQPTGAAGGRIACAVIE